MAAPPTTSAWWTQIPETTTPFLSDKQRTEWIEEQGFRVLRFWDNEVMQNIEAAQETIWQALA
jgi:very-short-patch-repair endonuclease